MASGWSEGSRQQDIKFISGDQSTMRGDSIKNNKLKRQKLLLKL